MIPLEVEEIGQLQMGIWKLSRDPDVLPLHNLCFCLGIDQPNTPPGRRKGNKYFIIYWSLRKLNKTYKDKLIYLPSIVRYGKASTRELGLDEALVVFKCLVQFLSKCFMCRFRKHAVRSNYKYMSLQPSKKNIQIIESNTIYIPSFIKKCYDTPRFLQTNVQDSKNFERRNREWDRE